MARFKPVKAKKKTPPARGAVPCILLLIGGMALLTLLFWAILRSS